MSYHDAVALQAGLTHVAQSLDAFLLDQCRCFAASRQTGSPLPLDRAFEALSALMPPAEACAVFGALHRFVAAIMTDAQPVMTWYPPSCRRASPSEMRVLAALARLSARDLRPQDEIATMPGSSSSSSLHAALGMLGGALLSAGLLPSKPPSSAQVTGLDLLALVEKAA